MGNLTWQTIRDALAAAGTVALLAGIDYLNGSLQAHPIGGPALTAAVLVALATLRRFIYPTEVVGK